MLTWLLCVWLPDSSWCWQVSRASVVGGVCRAGRRGKKGLCYVEVSQGCFAPTGGHDNFWELCAATCVVLKG